MVDENTGGETLGALLEHLVAAHGDAPALIFEGTTLSFTDLEHRVRDTAAGLAALGVGRGDKVAVWLPNATEWVVLEFALARLAAVAVAINTKFREHEVGDILERSGARALILRDRLKQTDYLSLVEQIDSSHLSALEHVVVVGDQSLPEQVSGRPAIAYAALAEHGRHDSDDATPDSPCNVFTSSGTTSAPKLVLHRQSAITHHARAVARRFGFAGAEDGVVLGMLPFCGVFGFNTVMGALAAGRPVVLEAVFAADEAVDLIERHRVTHTSGSDEMFRRIFAAALPVSRIASLREGAFANFSADAAALVTQADSLGIKLFQTFGSSEVQALMAYAPAGSGPERWALGGGTPSSDATRVRVRNTETGVLAADGESGEIEISGPNVMIEYMHNAEANAKSITEDGYVRTGDMGYIEGPESFVYLARLGDTLRLGGFLVNPREIEAYLEGFAEVALAQVVGVDTERGPRPVAFVIAEAGADIDEAAIIEACQARMAKFKVPVRIVALEAFPTTSSANGEKIQKAQLRQQAQVLVDGQVDA